MDKKYLFLIIKVQCGEYEFLMKSVHELHISDVEDDFAEDYAKILYNVYDWVDNGYYYFNGGEIAAQVYDYKPITKEEYDILNRFL